MSRTTKAALLVAAGGIAWTAGFLASNKSPVAPPAPPPAAIVAFPPDWAKCSAVGVKLELTGADRVTWTWLGTGVDDEVAAVNVLLPDDDNAPEWMWIKQPAAITFWVGEASTSITWGGNADFNGDGDVGTDADIDAFWKCLSGNCCPTCTADINGDGDIGTDADIEAMYAAIAGR